MKTFIVAALIGMAAGLLGALCGVGGGIVMVPAYVTILKLEQKQAVATSLACIVIIAIISTLNNARKPDLIDWRMVALTAGAAALAAWFGTDLMHKLSNQHLTRLFGVVLLVFGVKMLMGK
ncbi:sulfite exporter TauE/SafE family protein [Verrucomicrobiaceae bacterium N1E253]|uniref:Probable membrane transporter protein n=1 Tax=Oceaniferula marina TaxID=2748318 RepID=A0A851GGZ5_9BACT|nr:sulfite exporter TauE/SafE family protein [Oceaniferula marina]NWK55121.1 sulfite exporter TauE/SafE family protein [Oceaniferula marina]